MIVLDLLPYDAILGFDWLQTFSPMQCDWVAKTLQFQHQGKLITLKGLQSTPLSLNSISAKQMLKSVQGNDIWAYVIVDSPHLVPPNTSSVADLPEDINDFCFNMLTFFRTPNSYHHIELMTMLFHCIQMQCQSMQGHIITLLNTRLRLRIR
jgi:hypothetical protein